MKKTFFTIILLSSIPHLQGMEMSFSPMEGFAQAMRETSKQMYEYIKTGNIEALREALKNPNQFSREFFERSGLRCAMEENQQEIMKLFLACGLPMPQELPICSPDAIKTLFTRSVVRPSDNDLKTAPKRIVTFLCAMRRKSSTMPKPVRLLILERAGFIGDLMVKKLCNNKPIPDGFSTYAQNRLLECTITHFEILRRKALQQNPNIKIPEPLACKKEILAIITGRMARKPFLCNAKEAEPRTNCTIM